MNEKFIKQIEDYQKREGELMLQMRKTRKSVIETGMLINNNDNEEKNRLIEELRQSEIILSEVKLSFLEQKIQLENELKATERKAIDAKMKFADLITERDYYELEYRKLLKCLKSDTPKGKPKKIKSIFDVFVCN